MLFIEKKMGNCCSKIWRKSPLLFLYLLMIKDTHLCVPLVHSMQLSTLHITSDILKMGAMA